MLLDFEFPLGSHPNGINKGKSKSKSMLKFKSQSSITPTFIGVLLMPWQTSQKKQQGRTVSCHLVGSVSVTEGLAGSLERGRLGCFSSSITKNPGKGKLLGNGHFYLC